MRLPSVNWPPDQNPYGGKCSTKTTLRRGLWVARLGTSRHTAFERRRRTSSKHAIHLANYRLTTEHCIKGKYFEINTWLFFKQCFFVIVCSATLTVESFFARGQISISRYAPCRRGKASYLIRDFDNWSTSRLT